MVRRIAVLMCALPRGDRFGCLAEPYGGGARGTDPVLDLEPVHERLHRGAVAFGVDVPAPEVFGPRALDQVHHLGQPAANVRLVPIGTVM